MSRSYINLLAAGHLCSVSIYNVETDIIYDQNYRGESFISAAIEYKSFTALNLSISEPPALLHTSLNGFSLFHRKFKQTVVGQDKVLKIDYTCLCII